MQGRYTTGLEGAMVNSETFILVVVVYDYKPNTNDSTEFHPRYAVLD